MLLIIGTITLSGKNSQSDKFVSTIGMASIGGGKLVNETNGKLFIKLIVLLLC